MLEFLQNSNECLILYMNENYKDLQDLDLVEVHHLQLCTIYNCVWVGEATFGLYPTRAAVILGMVHAFSLDSDESLLTSGKNVLMEEGFLSLNWVSQSSYHFGVLKAQHYH